MKKGVSAVIATILMLIITIAIAGMAYMYISGVFTTQVQGIEVMEVICTEGTTDNISVQVKNIGTTVIGADTITYRQTSPSDDTSSGTLTHGEIESGSTLWIDEFDVCTGTGGRVCAYIFTPPIGRTQSGSVYCT